MEAFLRKIFDFLLDPNKQNKKFKEEINLEIFYLRNDMPKESKDELLRLMESLRKILKAIEEANKLTGEIKNKVYQIINPDAEM